MASSAKITTTIQTQRLIAMGTSSSGPLYLHMVKLEAKVETQAKRNASGSIVKVRTGNLRSSIHPGTEVRGTKLVGLVIADAEYALPVHEGSKAHDVVPTRKKVLAWKGAGGSKNKPNLVFAKRARIPAQPGRPFLRDALDVIR